MMDLLYFKAVDNLTLSHFSRLGVDKASDRRNCCCLFMLCASQFKTWNVTEWNYRNNLLHFIPWIWESTFTGNNFLRGDKFYPASAPSHALKAQ